MKILKLFSGITLALIILFGVTASYTPASNFLFARAQETTAPAEAEIDRVAVHQALLDLTNPWTVMCIAAHPDDEDGTSLTILRHKLGVHTVSVFSTYGEGGQNAVGPELYEELGVLRARETMAAATVQGSEPYFLGLKDFGFSKSADEAFNLWGHEEALRRMVLKIRELRPDVIITHHDTTSGHGHHQATGRLLLEAFDAAADPKRFPDQLKNDIQVWQVKRIFVRAFRIPQSSGASDSLITIDPNERDPVRGTTFAEQALQALQKHRTQGPWPKTVADMARFRNSTDGRLPLIRYRLVKQANDTGPLPKDSISFLAGLKLPDAEAAKLTVPMLDEQALSESDSRPDRALNILVSARKAGIFTPLDNNDAQRFELMNRRLDVALATMSGFSVTVTANDAPLIPGTTTAVAINISNNGSHALNVSSLNLHALGSERQLEAADQLPAGTEASKSIKIDTPVNATVSVPSARHLYDNHLFGESLIAQATAVIDGAQFDVHSSLRLEVVPAVEIRSFAPVPYVWTQRTRNLPLSFNISLVNHLGRAFNGTLSISAPTGIIGTGQKLSLSAGEARDVTLKSNALATDILKDRRQSAASHPTTISLTVRDAISDEPISSESVPIINVDAHVANGIRVGFIPSFDQTIGTSLNALGVAADKLSPADIQSRDLKQYNTIIIDNRGYEANPELIAANDRLLGFASDGGTLIVFYHKDNEWNPNPSRNRPQLAPYPILLSDARVTDENAPVTFLKPAHRLLNFPNRIRQSDFAGWIQERGLYYPKEWDSHYSALLAMNDPGEPPLTGGLLVASYGRGEYIYTSLVWYRELRAGIPGSYRMLANLISYGRP